MQLQPLIYFGKCHLSFCIAVTLAWTGSVFMPHCLSFLPLFMYHDIVTKKEDRIQTYHSRSCPPLYIEITSISIHDHDTGLYGQFQAFPRLL